MAPGYADVPGLSRADPGDVELGPGRLEAAVDFATANESPVAQDFSDHRERLAVEG